MSFISIINVSFNIDLLANFKKQKKLISLFEFGLVISELYY